MHIRETGGGDEHPERARREHRARSAPRASARREHGAIVAVLPELGEPGSRGGEKGDKRRVHDLSSHAPPFRWVARAVGPAFAPISRRLVAHHQHSAGQVHVIPTEPGGLGDARARARQLAVARARPVTPALRVETAMRRALGEKLPTDKTRVFRRRAPASLCPRARNMRPREIWARGARPRAWTATFGGRTR